MTPGPRIKTSYQKYVEWREEEVVRKRKHIVRVVVVTTVVIWAGAFALLQLFEAQRQNDIDTQAVVTYQVAVQVYNNRVIAHNECVDRIERQKNDVQIQLDSLQADRQFLAILVTNAEQQDEISTIDREAIAAITNLYDAREQAILEGKAPEDPDDCPPLPTEVPVSPITGIATPATVPVTTG